MPKTTPAVLRCLAVWLLCLGAPSLRAEILSASATVSSLSFELESGYSSAGYFLHFSTYDGVHTWARHQGGFGYSGEVRPDSIISATYRTDYDAEIFEQGLYGYGSASFTLPTTDSNFDGLIDILDRSRSGSFTATGTATEYLPVTGTVTYSLTGSFTRPSNNERGNYTITSASGYAVTGHFKLNGGSGTVTYNTATKSITFSGTFFSPDVSGTGTTTYQILDTSSVRINGFNFTDEGGVTRQINSFTLNRSGNRFTTKGTMVDGQPATAWVDYKDFHIALTDDNDLDADGVPDMADILIFTGATITGQPLNQTVIKGYNLTLTVTASSPYSMTYQWYHNDMPLAGRTNRTLSLTNVQFEQAGNYKLLVASVGKTNSSQTAVLTVHSLPAFSLDPTGVTLIAGQTLTLAAAADGFPAPAYLWTRNNMIVSGQNTATLTISNITAAQSGDYVAWATNAAGTTLSAAAKVVVTTGIFSPPPNVTTEDLQNTGFPINLHLENGKNYRLEYSTDLVTWHTLITFTSGGTTKQHVDAAAATDPRRFYRLVKP